MIQVPPDAADALRWFFSVGREPQLSRRERERHDHIDRALNGRCWALGRYIRALAAGATPAEAVTLVERETRMWRGEVPIREELMYFLRRYQTRRGRGRPMLAKRDHITIPREELEIAIPRATVESLPGERVARTGVVVRRTGEARAVTVPTEPSGMINRAITRGLLERSTWGDLRISAEAAPNVATMLGIDPGRDALTAVESAVRERVAAHRAAQAILEVPHENDAAPTDDDGYGPPPLNPSAADRRAQERAHLAHYFAAWGEAGAFHYVHENFRGKEKHLGRDYATPSEIAERTGLSTQLIHVILDATYPEPVGARGRVPIAWLQSDAALKFWRAVDRAVRTARRRRGKGEVVIFDVPENAQESTETRSASSAA